MQLKIEYLKPSEITPYSNKKVWWICNRGHEWEAVIGSRTGRDYGLRRSV